MKYQIIKNKEVKMNDDQFIWSFIIIGLGIIIYGVIFCAIESYYGWI